MNTDKYIFGIKDRVNKKIETLRGDANEAYGNWADTGYQKFMTKYERLIPEKFRKYISEIPMRLQRDSIPFQVGVRFGIIRATNDV